MRLLRQLFTLLVPAWLVFITIFTSTFAQQKLPALDDSTTSSAKAPSSTASSATSDKKEPASTTQKPKSSDTSSTLDLPGLTTTSDSQGLITGLPKLPDDIFPTPIVPPTANAPFMQRSTLPEGTVFICVGAALGFVGFAVIAWRGLVAWSLHRSVRRAALIQSSKYRHDPAPTTRRNSKVPFYSPGPGSTLSLDQLGASGKSGLKTKSARESLFFSPTAGGMQTPGTRGSGYLPAGYYAAGNATAGSGQGMTHIGGGATGNGNHTHRYSRARSAGPSPPLSPNLSPSRGDDLILGRPGTAGLSARASQSSLNLSAPPQGRAPSAYLEDLFENHPPGSGQNPGKRP